MKSKFFDLARRLSLKSIYHHKIGAVVVKKNKVIGVGFNKPHKTHPRATNAYKTVHAELDAVLGLTLEELDGADVYVYREYKSGEPATSKPCPHCESLLREAGVARVFYTCSNEGYAEMCYE